MSCWIKIVGTIDGNGVAEAIDDVLSTYLEDNRFALLLYFLICCRNRYPVLYLRINIMLVGTNVIDGSLSWLTYTPCTVEGCFALVGGSNVMM